MPAGRLQAHSRPPERPGGGKGWWPGWEGGNLDSTASMDLTSLTTSAVTQQRGAEPLHLPLQFPPLFVCVSWEELITAPFNHCVLYTYAQVFLPSVILGFFLPRMTVTLVL